MRRLAEKAQTKIGIIILAIIAVALITIISFKLADNSTTNKTGIDKTEDNAASVVVQKPEESPPASKVDVQPIVNTQQVVEQIDTPKESNQASESKQTEAPVRSIQEGQPKVEINPTPPSKPVPQNEVTNKAVKPTYKEQDVKPQQSQPKMGDKNDKGQIYVEGFGWITDEGGGGKGTTVDDMRENGNKIGIMD